MESIESVKEQGHPLASYDWILVLIGPIILFGPMLWRGGALFWGTPLLQFVPWRSYAIQMITEGYLPLWNPLVGMGAPLIANYQSAIFYPPNVLLALTGPAWGQGLLVMLHLQWAAVGMLLFLRRLGVRRIGQIIAGLAFSLSGYMVARAGFLSINAAAAWLPWVVLACDRLVEDGRHEFTWRQRITPALQMAVCLAMQWLAGHAQTSWYTLVFILVWAVWRSLAAGKLPGLIRNGLAIAMSGGIAFCLAAIQLIPTLEYLIHSQRASQVEAELAFTYSFWPWRFLGLLMPNLFGNPVGRYWGYGNFWEDAIYIGIVPLIFVLLGVVGAWKDPSRKGLLRFLLFVSGVSFLLALGQNTPLFPFLYEHVPTFNLFQAPTRWSLLAVFSLAVIAGIGTDIWQDRRVMSLFWLRLGTAGAASIPIFAWVAARILPSLEISFFLSLIFMGVLLLISGGIALLRPVPLNARWGTVIKLFVVSDLILAGWGLNPSIPLEVYRRETSLPAKVAAGHRVYMPEDVEYIMKFERTHTFEYFKLRLDWSIIREVGLPNTAMLEGISSANNFDPILSERYVSWMDALESLPVSQQGRLINLMDVGSVAVLSENSLYEVHYEHADSPQRARLVSDVNWVSAPEEALSSVIQASFNPEQVIVLEGPAPDTPHPTGMGGTVRISPQDNPNEVLLDVETEQGSWLLLSDTSFPGWAAFIDGNGTPIYHADYLFRAVYVPPGDHQVEFCYQPASFRWGAVLSIGALVCCILLWMIRSRDGMRIGLS